MSHDPDDDFCHVHVVRVEAEDPETLRWTPAVLAVDLLTLASDLSGALCKFFADQSESVGARASLREALETRRLALRHQEEARQLLRAHTLEDIAGLPEQGF